ncbi:tripartite motif-containing protein 16-like [Scleropages formosus]|uniref:Tripartite motif-containing protein 16-like n=1 Tax=Scleropages formosus TaxID=113540 RepID=A0A8C9S2S4_SCLFO|nr:tripartite motif-containing protein 16-like [Scleropages formosus]
MAQAGDLEQIQFSCSICLDLLKDPVTVPCGHSYCMDCIKGCWDQEDDAGVYSCPQCRQSFTSRPVLGRNTLLGEVMEKLKKTELQAAPFDGSPSAPGDVECDFCTGKKKKAVKSCLVCLASYCETHLQPHYESPTFKKHKLTDATGQLQDKICSLHDKVLEIYCRTDQQCICYLCTMDEHRGHDTVSAAAGRSEKEHHLRATQKKFQKRIKEKEEEVQELRRAVDSFTRSAQAALEDTESIFSEMICSIEKRRSEVRDLIRAQEKTALSQAEGLLEQLEQEIAEMERSNSELEHISHSQDDIHFLQVHQSMNSPLGPKELPSITVNPHCSFENVIKALSQLKAQVKDVCRKQVAHISRRVTDLYMVLPPHPTTREDFLKYICKIALDRNTMSTTVELNGDNQATVRKMQIQCDGPSRFSSIPQVLCREGLSGCSYWEVQWSGNDGVDIVVAYRDVNRSGIFENFRTTDKSWSLFCSPKSYFFCHNKKRTAVSGPLSYRIGVYLDHRAGTLSFYSVSRDTMTLLHRVQTTFTEPLYPGFSLYFHTVASNINLNSYSAKTWGNAHDVVGSTVQL